MASGADEQGSDNGRHGNDGRRDGRAGRDESSRGYGNRSTGSRGSSHGRPVAGGGGYGRRSDDRQGGYKPREDRGYQGRGGSGGGGGYGRRSDDRQGGYQPREDRQGGGYKPREDRGGGYQPREDRGYQGRGGGGYGRRSDDRQGGYQPRGDRRFGSGSDSGRSGTVGFREERFGDTEQELPSHQALRARENEPAPPTEFDATTLPFPVRAELRGLPKDLAKVITAHLVAAGELIDVAPDLAFEHAMAARRRAARLPVVREAAAETAYAAGEYQIALTEYRALHRMKGDPNYLPVLADCERALGRPQGALKLAREASDLELDEDQRIEMQIVEAGARSDLGQRAEGLRLLKVAISAHRGSRIAQSRLRFAYAAMLEESGDLKGAREWFVAADKYDSEHRLAARERIARLDGVEFVDEFEEEYFDEGEEPDDYSDAEDEDVDDEDGDSNDRDAQSDDSEDEHSFGDEPSEDLEAGDEAFEREDDEDQLPDVAGGTMSDNGAGAREQEPQVGPPQDAHEPLPHDGEAPERENASDD